MRSFPTRRIAAVLALALAAPRSLAAQGEPPAWVRRFLAAEHPQPFAHAWLARTRSVAPAPAVSPGAPAPPPGARALSGTFGVVVVAATFADVVPSFPTEVYQRAYFGEARWEGGYSLAQYYREVSGGRFTFTGTVTPWLALARTADSYEAHSPYPGRGRYLEYVRDALAMADEQVDWRLYDNDGPDGVPDSGDDDGMVDMVVLMHPLRDGVCETGDSGFTATGFRLGALFGGSEFVTHSVGARGSRLRVNDFVLAAGKDCQGERPSTMNIPIHEMGHALGLPDLNDLDRSSFGVGRWDVMGYGLYLADGVPAHPGAWSRRQLGWANVTRVPSGGTFQLGAVESGGEVLEVPVPGSREHFLLENRQRVGSDAALPGTGLLVWRVHPDVLDPAVRAYRGTEDETNPGLAVVQADGRNDLARRANFGDASDLFPGPGGVTSATDDTPAGTRDHAGAPTGTAFLGIAEAGGVVTLRVVSDTEPLAPPLQVLLLSGPPGGAQTAQLQGRTDRGTLAWSARTALPPGLSATADGVVSAPFGTLPADTLRFVVRDPGGRAQWVSAVLSVPLPPFAEAAGALLGGAPLSALQERALDLAGNRNGRFDAGDALILWLLSGSPAFPGGLP
jgi:M6 family metalloprotease-like protein